MIRRVTAGLTSALLVTTLTACNGESTGSATPPPFTPSSAPTTPTSTPSSPQAVASAGAEDGYRRFLAQKDATAASGGKNVGGLSAVATGAILGAELNQAATFRARKWRGVGQTKVLWTKALKVGPVGADGKIAEVTVQACYDSSESTAVDATGKSVKKPGTPTLWFDEMQMRMSGGAWKAHYGVNKAAKC